MLVHIVFPVGKVSLPVLFLTSAPAHAHTTRKNKKQDKSQRDAQGSTRRSLEGEQETRQTHDVHDELTAERDPVGSSTCGMPKPF